MARGPYLYYNINVVYLKFKCDQVGGLYFYLLSWMPLRHPERDSPPGLAQCEGLDPCGSQHTLIPDPGPIIVTRGPSASS